jgi:hypothetical protein
MSLNANINVEVRLDLSLEKVQMTSSVKELSSSFVASISDSYDISIQDLSFHVTPRVELHLQTKNTATPFDLLQNPSALNEFSFGGSFVGLVVVGMEGVPVEISLRALSQDITNTSSLQFDLSLDIDLVPIKDGEYNHPSVNFSIQSCVGSNTFLFCSEIIVVLNHISPYLTQCGFQMLVHICPKSHWPVLHNLECLS